MPDLDYLPCHACGQPTYIDDLDGKPEMTRLLRIIRFFRGQIRALQYAASRGRDFDILECGTCYGPGYVSNRGVHQRAA